ncbi:MAG: NUDIX hydrolase [Anaerolineales bacterium]|nr:NUDIX hydrolase [Anaerolineales bacterium]
MNYKYCPRCSTGLVKVEIEGTERQKCPGCDFVHWDSPIPVVAAIVERDGQVVLTQSKGWPGEFYALVAGFLEKAETPAQGALREVKEELGLDGEIVSFVGHYVFRRRNQIISVYHVRAEGQIVISDELAGYKISPPEELRPWPEGTGPALRDWLAARGIGNTGATDYHEQHNA